MRPSHTTDPEQLALHLDGLRALAEGLARSPDLADDLRQETWLAVHSSPPPRAGAARAWLATMMRNIARHERRAASRRRDHEGRAADAKARELAPSASDVVERVALQRRVVSCLLELADPYRETLLLRFYDQHSITEIAERMDVPTGTVKTRIARGLARLREKLSAELDERERALFALWLPRAEQAPAHAALLAWSALAVAAAAMAYWIVPGAWNTPREPLRVARATPSAPAAPAAPLPGARTTAPRRSIGAARSAPRPTTFRALDLDLRPIADLRFEGARAATDADGRFTLDAAPSTTAPAADDWVIVARPVDAHASVPFLLAQRAAVTGEVVDTDGNPLPRAQVVLEFQHDFWFEHMKRDEIPLRGLQLERFACTTDGLGRFELQSAPRDGRVFAACTFDGHEEGRVRVGADEPLRIVLRPIAPRPFVSGRVVDRDGEPISAWVAGGDSMTMTDGHGRFQLESECFAVEQTLRAARTGLLPDSLSWTPGDPDPVLRLGGPAASIHGVVVDARGRPRSGVRVRVTDLEPFGRIRTRRDPDAWSLAYVEETLYPHAGPYGADSADDGSFQLDGLLERPYALTAIDRTTLERAVGGPFPAPTGADPITLVLDAGERPAPVRARVVDANGQPLAGIELHPLRTLHPAEAALGERRLLRGPSRVTDAEGGAAWSNLVRDSLTLVTDANADWTAAAANAEHGVVEIVLTRARHDHDTADTPPLENR
ncbi:MAG: RNA polymerase sigma factor [bacterium]|nr:RNA polymerase sigma factor [bacterium]